MTSKPEEYLIERFLQNTATTQEAKTVLEWLSTAEGQQYITNRFDKDASKVESEDEILLDHIIDSAKIFKQIESKTHQSDAQQSSRFAILYKSWRKIAAILLIPLLIAAGMLIWQEVGKNGTKSVWQDIYVPRGERMQVDLSDGTHVWLNSDTHLKYPINFKGNSRPVVLIGEAYFKVQKDSQRPFFVKTQSLTVKVTGTSFNVKAYEDENRVIATLDEGRISLVLNNSGKKEYVVKPGQQALYIKRQEIVSINPSCIGQNSMWRENTLEFDNAPMPEMLRILERYYNVKFRIVDQDVAKYKYTIRFENETLQSILEQLQRITPIRCVLRNEIIEISRLKI